MENSEEPTQKTCKTPHSEGPWSCESAILHAAPPCHPTSHMLGSGVDCYIIPTISYRVDGNICGVICDPKETFSPIL